MQYTLVKLDKNEYARMTIAYDNEVVSFKLAFRFHSYFALF